MALNRVWHLAFVAVSCWLSVTSGQENAMPRVPNSLIECYNGSGLYNKENLLPMTLTTLVDIVRKVEASEDGRNMNLVSLTTSMLHRFKLDGIERNPNVADQPGVIPYTVPGTQFYKHRLLLIMLIPDNNYRFPNDTLTPVERCTLHFMLSKSIERYQRGDEGTTCSRLATSSSQSYRRRRSIEEGVSSEVPPVPVADPTAVQVEDDGSGLADTEVSSPSLVPVPAAATIAQEPSPSNSPIAIEENIPSASTIANEEAIPIASTTVEELTSNVVETDNPTTSAGDVELVKKVDETQKKGDMFLDPHENLRLYGTPKASGRYLDEIDGEESENIHEEAWPLLGAEDVSYSPRSLSASAMSDCPVENGVVFTAAGAVTVGTVLAGIVAGLVPQTVALANLQDTSLRSEILQQAISLSATSIDNRWAATLAGDLAEVTLFEGPLGTMQAGAAGGWNDTRIPRWYFLRDANRRNSHLTDADVRAGIDGMALAMNIQAWARQVPELRLSEVLETYYSDTGLFQTRFRGCQRKDNFLAVAPSVQMVTQTASFATILGPESIVPAQLSFDAIRNYSQIASNLLISYVPSGLVDQTCSTTPGSSTTASPNRAADLLIVLDSGWDYTYITSLLAGLMDRLQVNPYFSNITIISGQQPQMVLNSTSRQADFFLNFTLGAYNNLTRGMNLRALLGTNLVLHFQNKLEAERRLNIAGGHSTAVLFVPAQGYSVSDDDLQACIQSFNWYKFRLPDVKFFYLIAGNGDRYRNLVDDSSRDIFTLTTGLTGIETTVTPIASRFTTLHQRIVNPNCGSDWVDRSYSSTQFAGAIDPFTVSYYRLHPNYFYSSTAGVLRVQGSPSGSLRVCWSRSVELPNNASSSSSTVTCQVVSSNAYEIPLASACDGTQVSQCQPVYLSIESTSDSTSNTCADRTVCRSVRNLRYFISHEGLGCTAGSGQVVINTFLTGIAAISVVLCKRLFESST